MRSLALPLAVAVVALIATGGCATREEWDTWYAHPTHFASGQHLFFSVKNREGTSPRVTQGNIAMARDEAWWGKAVSVSQEQILQR